MKNKIRGLFLLVMLGALNPAFAASFFFDTYPGSGTGLTLRLPDGSVLLNAPITNGGFTYDTALGTSSGSINVPDGSTPTDNIYLYNMSILETSYGSLFMTAQMDALGGTAINVAAEFKIDYTYDFNSDVTIFSLSTLDSDGDGVAGIQINDGGFTGLSLDVNGSMSYLAYVDNPFPTYVPVPAAVWLFGSGLIGLAAFIRRKKI